MLANPLFAVALALVVGLCVGSFLNVVVHRLPKMMERDWRAQCAELRDEPPPPGVRQLRHRGTDAGNPCLVDDERREVRLRKVPVVVRLLLAAHRMRAPGG